LKAKIEKVFLSRVCFCCFIVCRFQVTVNSNSSSNVTQLATDKNRSVGARSFRNVQNKNNFFFRAICLSQTFKASQFHKRQNHKTISRFRSTVKFAPAQLICGGFMAERVCGAAGQFDRGVNIGRDGVFESEKWKFSGDSVMLSAKINN
jgi:hypothetical protein